MNYTSISTTLELGTPTSSEDSDQGKLSSHLSPPPSPQARFRTDKVLQIEPKMEHLGQTPLYAPRACNKMIKHTIYYNLFLIHIYVAVNALLLILCTFIAMYGVKKLLNTSLKKIFLCSIHGIIQIFWCKK